MPAMPPPTTSTSLESVIVPGWSGSRAVALLTPPLTKSLAFLVAAALSLGTHEQCSLRLTSSRRYGFRPALSRVFRKVLLNRLHDLVLSRFGTSVQVCLAHDDTRQVPDVVGDGFAVDCTSYVGAAPAHEDADSLPSAALLRHLSHGERTKMNSDAILSFGLPVFEASASPKRTLRSNYIYHNPTIKTAQASDGASCSCAERWASTGAEVHDMQWDTTVIGLHGL